ncbi:MAG: sugar transferase [Candidatus Margulisbacteria bacterium]|nr:sugar transferase [Candidatus Margulisiibacteriota bacterium]
MFILVRLITDIIIISLSYILAYSIKFNLFSWAGIFSFPLFQYANYLLFILFIYLLVFFFVGMYKLRKGFLIEFDELWGIFFSLITAWSILIVLTFIRGEYEYSRPIILLSWPISFIALTVARQVILRIELIVRAKGYGSKKAAIIGLGQLAQTVAQKIKEHPAYGVNFVGFIGENGQECLGKLVDINRIVDQNKIEILYIADKSISREKLTELAEFCAQRGISLGTIPDVFEILTTSPSVEDIEGLPIVSLKETRFTPLNRFFKRTFDLVLSLFGIIIFAVPMIIIAILVRITSPGGPAVYKQERVGRQGKVFNVCKFRTMIPNAEESTGPILATEDDPRKTAFGKFLRMTNLDELPQLFNILEGDMSFVGPRPERPEFVREFRQLIPKYMERHKIRPGLAGWAQLHGGYNMPAEEKIKYDLYYVENWSFLLDIKIILKYIQIAFTLQRRN